MKLFAVLVLFPFFVLAATSPEETYQKELSKITSDQKNDSSRLEKLFKSTWDYQMHISPEWATYVGYPGQNANWSDNSFAAIKLHKKIQEMTLKAVKSIHRNHLKADQTMSYDLFLKDASEYVEGFQYPDELLPINQMGGIQMDIADIMWAAPKLKKSDYEDMLQRLEKSPKVIENVQALMEEGLRQKVVQSKIALAGVPKQFDDLLKPKVEDSPIFQPFQDITKSISADDQKVIQEKAKTLIKEKVYPALQKFRDFVVNKYIPGCRDNVSFASLPNGSAWYAFKARRHTSVTTPPLEIHELGLREVARIRGEMEKVKTQAGFKGDLNKFNEFLKNDSQFFYQDPKDLMTGFRNIAKRIDPELPKLFGKLPRLPYGVREMPAYKAPTAPTAYYEGGSIESGRAGYFETNTYNLKARPKWQMEVLTLHEAVPGHHLQLSLAQEINGLPEFRKQTGPTAFVEGWGLYSESLGEELGLYTDPYSKYGQLTFEIWRAVRLVVDTGMHAKGWTRDQVIQYFKDNTPISEQQIINETDRYIADPGQALAYKIGELKFKSLRKEATEKLGERFSIRDFHDALLSDGALPMDVLEQKMQTWIQAQLKVAAKSSSTGDQK